MTLRQQSVAALIPPIDASKLSPEVKALVGDDFDYSKRRGVSPRRLARVMLDALPADTEVLDFTGIEVLSPSVADEILKQRPGIKAVNMNEDVALSWQIAEEHNA